MSHELMYTSAPKGLFAGARGFCTVTATRGLPHPLIEKLEALSAYRPLFPPLDPRAHLNPVAYSHLRVAAGGRTYSVVSRVGPAGLDYSDRTNLFAHHVVLDANELPRGGPAWLLRQPGFMAAAWDGNVRFLAAGRPLPAGDPAPAPCRAWQQAAGDAGWAGVVAEAFVHDPGRVAYLLFDPGLDPLPLVAEALSLLPPDVRWDVTFSTYYTGLPQGLACAWRCVPRGSAEAAQGSRLPGVLLVNLGTALGPAAGGKLVEQARTGRGPAPVAEGPEDTIADADPGIYAGRVPVARPYRPASVPEVTVPADWPATPPAPRPAAPPPVPRPDGGRLGPWLAGLAVGTGFGVVLAAVVVGIAWLTRGAQEARLQAAVRAHEADQGAWGKDKEAWQAERKKLEEQAQQQEQANHELKWQNDGLKQQNAEARNRRKAAEQRVQELQERLDRLAAEREQLQRTNRALQWMLQRPGGRPPAPLGAGTPRLFPRDQPTADAETLTLPPFGQAEPKGWDLKGLGLKPGVAYQLVVEPLPRDQGGVVVDGSRPRESVLTLFARKEGKNALLGAFKVRPERLEFQWREDPDREAVRLLKGCKLRLIDPGSGDDKVFKIDLP
jgi:hypothetical protein